MSTDLHRCQVCGLRHHNPKAHRVVVWGGLTARERYKIRRAARAAS